jgi:DNA-directed RNA polymerase III subunit RPC1
LAKVMRTPGIDFKQTTTNHILETREVLGIEAARQSIINEIKFTMGSYGIHIDERHT